MNSYKSKKELTKNYSKKKIVYQLINALSYIATAKHSESPFHLRLISKKFEKEILLAITFKKESLNFGIFLAE